MESRNNHLPRPDVDDPETAPGAPKLVAVLGPTAVGKTGLGVELALRFGGEVVNADSRYLYRGFDIGVAKPTADEMRGVPHHLIDVLPPDGGMSLAVYQDLANAAVRDVLARGRVPFLVGGTPLYANAVLEGWRIPRVPPDPAIRARLEREAEDMGLPALAERLRRVDPAAFARSGQNLRRVVRALEVWEVSGVPMSAQEGKGPRPYRTLELGLSRDREALFAAIDARIRGHLEAGLVDEVRGLLDAGVPADAPAMASIGYRQLLPHLAGEESLEDAAAAIARDTRRYVRHQETWLRRNPRLVTIDTGTPGWRQRADDLVAAFLAGA